MDNRRIKLYFKKMLKKNKEVVINRANIIEIFGENIEEIDLSDYIIHKITSNCFSDFNNLKIIKLGNKNLKIIEPFSFINCQKLSEIHIKESVISELVENTFYNLPLLERLIISNNKNLYSIKHGFIKDCNDLRDIIIGHSKIVTLDSGILSNYNFLESISIHNCNISILKEDTFFNLPKLLYLYLNNNTNLISIEPGFIKNCNKLQNINICNNKISELKENTFYNLPHRYVLDLSYCRNLQSIYSGFANGCKLGKIILNRCAKLELYSDTFLNCNNLSSISICNSGISKFNKDTFSNLPELEYLHLNNNQNLRIIESGFINNCRELKYIGMFNNISLSSIDENIIYNCHKLRQIDLHNCNIQILHIDSFKELYNIDLNIENNRLLMHYLSEIRDIMDISHSNNLLNIEDNYIFNIIRDDLIDARNGYYNDININELYSPNEPNMDYENEPVLLSHYRYCIKSFKISPDRNNNFESFMNLLSQIDEIDNSIIIKNIFIILFIIILFLCEINIYYDKKSLEDNILHLLSIINDALATKFVKNNLSQSESFSENISDEIKKYIDPNKYIIKHIKIIIKIIGYLVDIYKGSSNYDNMASKFDSIMGYLFINNMKNKRKKINIDRTIKDKRLELLYIIKAINGSLELPKLKEGEIGLLLHYLIKLINFKKMNKINNAEEIQRLSEHRNIQKNRLIRTLKTHSKESVNNTIINYYDMVSDMYIRKLLSNNIKYRINRKNLD